MPKVKVNGIEIPYEQQGSGKEKFVFIHGGFSSRKSWGWSIWPLLPSSYRCFAPDMRGHGDLADKIPDKECFAQMTDDIYKFSKELKLEKFICVGLSMGGRLALQLGLEHPEVLKALILFNPGSIFGATVSPEIAEQAPLAAGNRDIITLMEKGYFVRTPDEKLLGKLIDESMLVKKETVSNVLAPNLVHDVDARLSKMEIPTLVVVGAKDTTISPDFSGYQEKMANAIPHSKKVVYSDEGHLIFIENTKRLAIELKAFVEQLG